MRKKKKLRTRRSLTGGGRSHTKTRVAQVTRFLAERKMRVLQIPIVRGIMVLDGDTGETWTRRSNNATLGGFLNYTTEVD